MGSDNRRNNNNVNLFLFSLVFSLLIYFTATSFIPNDNGSLFNSINKVFNLQRNPKSNFSSQIKYVSKIENDLIVIGEDEGYTDDISYSKNEDPIEDEFEPENGSESYENKKMVIPSGMTIGVRINTDGIMVLGTGYVNGESGAAEKPAEGILKPGDLIYSVNGKQVNTKEELSKEIENAVDQVFINLKRDNESIELSVTPIKAVEDSKNKIGVWVRDSTQGIGTITYYDPETGKFAALGHGILDVDTKRLMSIKEGSVMETDIRSVKKGKKGSPGELIGEINTDNIIGTVKLNNEYGLYGVMNTNIASHGKSIQIASKEEIHEGEAIILSNIEGGEVREYKVIIEAVNRNPSDDSKSMVIKIVDMDLLSKTNGIVQGMSGSPIIQDDKLIGAVTHVFVQDPTKGYGIFIEKMLNQEKSI